jgi:glycosyltransferase involved in cell wall biosynthesis
MMMVQQENRPIQILSLESSIGIHKYSRDLASALGRLGYGPTIASSLDSSRDCLIHPQLGNSTRSLWPMVNACRDSLVVTLHDVVPRNWFRRALMAKLQSRSFSRHHVVVHSRYSRDLLRRCGYKREIRIIPHGAYAAHPCEKERMKVRNELGAGGRTILISAGRIGFAKSCHHIFRLARNYPQFFFLFVGKVMDSRMKKHIDYRLSNVKVIEGTTDLEFRNYICASDALLNFRTRSVGEVSGPVVMAHGVGTPVIGYDVGFMPEYCGPEDLLFSADHSLERVFEALGRENPTLVRIPENGRTVCSWNEAAKQYSETYSQVLSES